METGYGIPNSLQENFEDGKDIKMCEFEEGELVKMFSKTKLVSNIESQQTRSGTIGTETLVNKESGRKKEKNKGNKGTPFPSLNHMNCFVTNVCRQFGERKSYLIWEAVACLGLSAVRNLVKEAQAIQACGGQKTADGRCFRTGGRILWNIIKARRPNAYKQIIKRGVEFEMSRYKELMEREGHRILRSSTRKFLKHL
ncbi:PREDICTED: uncharacterized protein LOC109181644 [Ipomoea nil]|uniref:uncharacterized protein LOC109181644 n=1 Tax=Ipomoea nil TaxID=35883 RepID=UPI000901DC6C|nr:PREDICTED: uncharacterized protein LOC109181644 [Ipomoea nil]XP_019187051.1 PREDICTED: uncharacterized protein LOC109181644 [Ipomoea nil]